MEIMKWKVRDGFVFMKGLTPFRAGDIFEANLDQVKTQTWKIELVTEEIVVDKEVKEYNAEDNTINKTVVEKVAPIRTKVNAEKSKPIIKKFNFNKVKK